MALPNRRRPSLEQSNAKMKSKNPVITVTSQQLSLEKEIPVGTKKPSHFKTGDYTIRNQVILSKISYHQRKVTPLFGVVDCVQAWGKDPLPKI